MVARTADKQSIEDIKYLARANYVLTMSQNDTFTASEFVSTENLKSVTLVQSSDGTVLTTSVLNNVVTCTSVIVSQKCTLTIIGVRV